MRTIRRLLFGFLFGVSMAAGFSSFVAIAGSCDADGCTFNQGTSGTIRKWMEAVANGSNFFAMQAADNMASSLTCTVDENGIPGNCLNVSDGTTALLIFSDGSAGVNTGNDACSDYSTGMNCIATHEAVAGTFRACDFDHAGTDFHAACYN